MNKLPTILPEGINPLFSSKGLMEIKNLPDDNLPPKQYLDKIISKIDLEPMLDLKPAAILAKELMQCYPSQNDTRVKSKFFGQQVVMAFANYTEAVCLNARQDILENSKFLPSLAEINTALKNANHPRVSTAAAARRFLMVREERGLDA